MLENSVISTLVTIDIQQKTDSKCNLTLEHSHTVFDMKVTTTQALPVYLILSAGANRSQTIDLIKENDGWPHQVSLIENKHETNN